LVDADLDIPEYLDKMDVRKPANLYVMDKLHEILTSIFANRRNVEKTLSRGELLAYDHVIAKMLEPDTLMGKLKYEVQMDKNEVMQLSQMIAMGKDEEESREVQLLKQTNV
jgi:hypothetical protein